MTTSPLADVQLHLVESVSDAVALKTWLSQRREGPLAVDTESSGLSAYRDKLRLIQIGDLNQGWAIPWEQWGGLALEVFHQYDGDWVAHNSIFDWQFIAEHTGYELPWERLHDTLTMARLDDPTRSNGLKPLASKIVDPAAAYGQRALDEGMKDNGWTWGTVPIDYAPYWLYASLDPVETAHLERHFTPRIQATCPEAYSLERAANRICTAMMRKGLLLDVPYVEDSIADFDTKSKEIRDWLKSAHKITSPKSSGQIAKAMEAAGQKVVHFTDRGAPRFDKDALKFYATSGENTAVRQLAEYIRAVRHVEDIRDRYSAKFLELRDANDVVRANVNVMGARTGRMSVSDPALQQLPRDDKVIRGSFIPRPGYVLISCDLDQVEARLAAHFSQDDGLIEAFRKADEGGGDFFCGVASQIFGEPISKDDHRRQLTKNTVYGCVPLEYQILTRRGWLRCDEVEPGDETIGYDPIKKRSVWTKITKLHHYPSAELVKVGNAHQSYVTTPNHRWFSEKRRYLKDGTRALIEEFCTTEELSKEHRIILAAPFDQPHGVPINDDEAAILGWLLSDGSLRVNYVEGGPSQAGGTKRMVTGEIRQSVKKYAAVIDDLLVRNDVPHKRYMRDSQPDYVVWNLHGPWVRDLIRRAGSFYDTWPDAAIFAASLSSSQASAMLNAMQLADGKPFTKTKSWQIELVSVLTYMAGEVSTERWEQPTAAWSKKMVGKVYSTRPFLTGQRITKEPVGEGPVWCVTTELGTWTMRVPDERGSRIVLTGNSIYGAGVEKMAQTAGVTEAQMTPVKAAFDKRFPGLKTMSDRIVREARQYERPTTFTPLGRPLIADKGREHTQLPNAKIQGTAAEYLKQRLVVMDAAGLIDMLVLPVHDEILLEAPVDQAEEVLKTVEACMTDTKSYRVPLTAGGKIMPERWQK